MCIRLVQVDLFGRAPEIVVDIHEAKREKDTSITLFLRWAKTHDIAYAVKKLDVGDLILPDEYVIERKTIRDFLNSLFGKNPSGRLRLYDQLAAMVKAYKHPILLIEGGLAIRKDPNNRCIFIPKVRRPWKERLWWVVEERINVSPKAFDSAIEKIEEMGVKVILSFDARHGAEILKKIYLQIRGLLKEEPSKKYAIVRAKPKLKTIYDWQLFFLSGLPGISVARAKKLLAKYKTPFDAIKNVQRWSVDIDGIGPATVEKVSRVLFSKFKEKNNSEKNN